MVDDRALECSRILCLFSSWLFLRVVSLQDDGESFLQWLYGVRARCDLVSGVLTNGSDTPFLLVHRAMARGRNS